MHQMAVNDLEKRFQLRPAMGKVDKPVKVWKRETNECQSLFQFLGNGSGSRLIISLSPFPPNGVNPHCPPYALIGVFITEYHWQLQNL